MIRKKIIHVFDVDGTLTHNDSFLLLFNFFSPSFFRRLQLWLSVLPTIFSAIAQGQAWKIKQALLHRLWKNETQVKITNCCKTFFEQNLKPDLRQNALEYIQQLKNDDPDVKLVLLSASCKEWLQPLANFLQADLICTELQYDHQQVFTGKFVTPNCKGLEKCRRLIAKYPAGKYEFICYGDSPSDKHLQSISKQFFYRYF